MVYINRIIGKMKIRISLIVMAAQLAKSLINEITRVTEPMSGHLAMFEEADPGKYNCIR